MEGSLRKILLRSLLLLALFVSHFCYADSVLQLEPYFKNKIQIKTTIAPYALYEQNILLINQTIPNSLRYDRTIYTQPIQLENVVLMKNLNLNYSIFQSPFLFVHSQNNGNLTGDFSLFHKPVDLAYDQIRGRMNFYYALFLSTTRFYHMKVTHACSFFNATFSAITNFSENTFFDNVEFAAAKFKMGAMFHNTYFYGSVDFAKIKTFGDLIFDGTSFAGDIVTFDGASFHGHVLFKNTTVKNKIDFSNISHITYPIDLTGITPSIQGREILINLLHTDLKNINLNYAAFKLYFPQDATNEDIIALYDTLLFKFKSHQQMNSYKKLYKEYKAYLHNDTKSEHPFS